MRVCDLHVCVLICVRYDILMQKLKHQITDFLTHLTGNKASSLFKEICSNMHIHECMCTLIHIYRKGGGGGGRGGGGNWRVGEEEGEAVRT